MCQKEEYGGPLTSCAWSISAASLRYTTVTTKATRFQNSFCCSAIRLFDSSICLQSHDTFVPCHILHSHQHRPLTICLHIIIACHVCHASIIHMYRCMMSVSVFCIARNLESAQNTILIITLHLLLFALCLAYLVFLLPPPYALVVSFLLPSCANNNFHQPWSCGNKGSD